ncbi:MAG: hypothetical protein HYZ53_18785 [Planctomycetes bacterium]|nr:hypothetical protein [Planctomycetota bacterium]
MPAAPIPPGSGPNALGVRPLSSLDQLARWWDRWSWKLALVLVITVEAIRAELPFPVGKDLRLNLRPAMLVLLFLGLFVSPVLTFACNPRGTVREYGVRFAVRDLLLVLLLLAANTALAVLIGGHEVPFLVGVLVAQVFGSGVMVYRDLRALRKHGLESHPRRGWLILGAWYQFPAGAYLGCVALWLVVIAFDVADLTTSAWLFLFGVIPVLALILVHARHRRRVLKKGMPSGSRHAF